MRKRWADWLAETHGAGFELVRHFLRSFLVSDLFSSAGDLKAMAIGLFALLAAFGFQLPRYLYGKYLYLHGLPDATEYVTAITGDRMLILAISMLPLATVSALLWSRLYPDERDTLLLLPKPLSAGQIVRAKFLACLLFMAVLGLGLNFATAILFPTLTAGRWSPAAGTLAVAHFAAAFCATAFGFFSVAALLGAAMWFLPARAFRAASWMLQGLVLLVLLALWPQLTVLPSLDPFHSGGAEWLLDTPIAWYAGVSAWLAGDATPVVVSAARQGLSALAIAVGVTLLSYFLGYVRRGSLAVAETTRGSSRWSAIDGLGRLLVRDPTERELFGFLVRTLARSGTHRFFLIAFVGLAIALAVDGAVTGIRKGLGTDSGFFLEWSLALPLLFVFVSATGFRQLIDLPVQLGANWCFRLHDPAARLAMLDAAAKAMFSVSTLPVLVLTTPLVIRAFGWMPAVGHLLFLLCVSQALHEWLLRDWNKMGFACSYHPSQRNLTASIALYLGNLSWFVFMLSAMEAKYLRAPFSMMVLTGLALAVFVHLRRRRLAHWGDRPLEFEDRGPDALNTLDLSS